MLTLEPGPRRGCVIAPPSKSHTHRLLIANFLAGARDDLTERAGDCADIRATKRCLRALASEDLQPELDCGESGSTLRFLAPIASVLGRRPRFVRRGRLAERPFKAYDILTSGEHLLPGDVSSQFVTGLLFALPLLPRPSTIRFTAPLESRGYVEMTLRVIRAAGVCVTEAGDGYEIPGGQVYRPQTTPVEGDWSGAAFWYGMNALGSRVAVEGLTADSAQPDRVIADWSRDLPRTIDVAQCPDLFPILSVMAAGRAGETVLTGIHRLRLKECDRVEAMKSVLTGFGRAVAVSERAFRVTGSPEPFRGGMFSTCADHRIALSLAAGTTRADAPVILDDASCADKSYPGFFDVFTRLRP